MEVLRVEPGGVVAAVSVEDGEYPLVLARSEEGRWVHVVHYQILVLIRRTDAAPGDAGRLAERSVRFREHLPHHRRSPGHVPRVAGRSHRNTYLAEHGVTRSSAPADRFRVPRFIFLTLSCTHVYMERCVSKIQFRLSSTLSALSIKQSSLERVDPLSNATTHVSPRRSPNRRGR